MPPTSHVHHPAPGAGDEPYVAEEGAFAAATCELPVLHYWPIRGRAEPIRLALALNQVAWFEAPIGPIEQLFRVELDGYTFRQLPRYIDEVNGPIDSVQAPAILRHLARKYDLYGGMGNLTANLQVDMLVDGCADIFERLRDLFVVDLMAQGPRAAYEASVLAPEADLPRMADVKGPLLACLERYLRLQSGGGPWLVGASPTIADIAAYHTVDLHLRYFAVVAERFPALMAHRARFSALPGVAEYLASANHHKHVFLREWREAQAAEAATA